MSFWKRSMEYLGLGPDDAYDDYDEFEAEPPSRQSRASRDDSRARGQSRNWPAEPDADDVRTVRPSFPSRDFDGSRRPASISDLSAPEPRAARGSRERERERERPAPPPNAEPATVRPRNFNQAQELADRFKEGNPVILNLESADREMARRLIDFASGVCYSLDGTMEKVATGVYLLKPAPPRVRQFDDFH